MSDNADLSLEREAVQQAREALLAGRARLATGGISIGELHDLARTYADAMAEYHRLRWPGRRFRKPSPGYLIRAL